MEWFIGKSRKILKGGEKNSVMEYLQTEKKTDNTKLQK